MSVSGLSRGGQRPDALGLIVRGEVESTPSAEAVFGIVDDPAVDPTELSADNTLARRSMSAWDHTAKNSQSLEPSQTR
jgi:hypothetical protein